MIKANELRIGNWLKYPNSKPFRISISDFKDGGSLDEDLDIIEPILLTDEIIAKCGFENKSLEFIGDLSGQSLQWHSLGVGYLYGQDSCTTGQSFVFMCKYLHQLQNLIYSLTGSELEVVW